MLSRAMAIVAVIERNENMTAYLINKNLCCYYWLRQRIGKNRALRLARTTEKVIVMFGRERIKLGPIKHRLF
jgi:hypothetical protein